MDVEDVYSSKYLRPTQHTHESPSGKYELIISYYTFDGKTYSRGIVTGKNAPMGAVLNFDIKRDHHDFPFAFATRNGEEWLVCAKKYRGQSMINLDTGYVYDNPGGANSFCWINVLASPDGQTFMIRGRYNNCDVGIKFYEFKNYFHELELSLLLKYPLGTLCDTLYDGELSIEDYDFEQDNLFHYKRDVQYSPKFKDFWANLTDGQLARVEDDRTYATVIDITLERKGNKMVLYKNNLPRLMTPRMSPDLDFTVKKTKEVILDISYSGFFIPDVVENLYVKYNEEQGIVGGPVFVDWKDRENLNLIRALKEIQKQGLPEDDDDYEHLKNLIIVEVRDELGWKYRIEDIEGPESIHEYFVTENGKWRCIVEPINEDV